MAKRGLNEKVPSSRLRSKSTSKHAPTTTKSEIIYEVKDYSDKVRSQKAASILKRALNPDAVIFEFDNMGIPADPLVEEIEGYTNLDLYRRRSNSTILEIVFEDETNQQKALQQGIAIDKIVYKGYRGSTKLAGKL